MGGCLESADAAQRGVTAWTCLDVRNRARRQLIANFGHSGADRLDGSRTLATIRAALKANASIGEACGAMRDVFGEYKGGAFF